MRRRVDPAQRPSPLDPLFYAMLGTRAFSHMTEGEDAAAASGVERACQWAADSQVRDSLLTSDDFFCAFPIRSAALRWRKSRSPEELGFQSTCLAEPKRCN